MTERVLSFDGDKAARIGVLVQVAQRLTPAVRTSSAGWKCCLAEAMSVATGRQVSAADVYGWMGNYLRKEDIAELSALCVRRTKVTKSEKTSPFSDDVRLQAEMEHGYREAIGSLPESARTRERLAAALCRPPYVIASYLSANPEVAKLLADGGKTLVELRRTG